MSSPPIHGYENEIYIKPTITNPNIIVGDFTYIADSQFESHVTHLYEWNGYKLIIDKFCQIAAGVEFVIIGANSVVGSDAAPFPIVAGNPAREIRKRFDDELIDMMVDFKWWDKSVDEINSFIPLLTDSNLAKVKAELARLLGK